MATLTHPSSPNNLTIAYINVNSLINLNRRFDLQMFINQQNPDLVIADETKLNEWHNFKYTCSS